ncbi:FecR family protein [Tunicatimonas pelagia]|uniref:FecR family protein n=1 Tax=Tunicatimonas pelagia TaxID=931531 RepID=UPI002665B363|nr:FecR domain-containing protein [Tunicatimonas pelagia]WKN41799.1 FecR domain-containing protein [Tunicatimonas pelagia]
MKDSYADFSVDDFLQDPYFYEWVRFPTPEHHAFWQSWLIQHPEKRKIVDQAQRLLKSIIENEESPPPHFKAEDWKAIQQKIARQAPSELLPSKSDRPIRTLRTWVAAASVLLILGVGIALYLHEPTASDWTSVRTQYGEQQPVTLPDGSEVILNGNSTLRYSTDWEEQPNRREVWLEGEAFFSVTKQQNKSQGHFTKFTVHANELRVEVRGTQFNVQNRPENTQVVLHEGKVLIRNEQQDSVLLRPNELAESDAHRGIQKKTVNAQHFISWKDQVLTFSEEPIKNIFDRLENTYGWQIAVQDSSWLQQKYTGSVPTDRTELLFDKFSLLYELDIAYQDRQVTIK